MRRVFVIETKDAYADAMIRALSLPSSGFDVVGCATSVDVATKFLPMIAPDYVVISVSGAEQSKISRLKSYSNNAVVVCGSEQELTQMKRLGFDHCAMVDIAQRTSPAGYDKVISSLKAAKQGDGTPRIKVGRLGSELIAIGGSLGGTKALPEIIKAFPEDIPPTLAVLHLPPVFTDMFAKQLDAECLCRVVEAQNGTVAQRGIVYIAPGGLHMRVDKTGDGQYRIRCAEGPKVHSCIPAVNPLFDSVALCARSNAVGVILTGMGEDGADGLKNMRQAGAMTIGQDEKSSFVYGMPRKAMGIGAVALQVPLESIVPTLMYHLTR